MPVGSRPNSCKQKAEQGAREVPPPTAKGRVHGAGVQRSSARRHLSSAARLHLRLPHADGAQAAQRRHARRLQRHLAHRAMPAFGAVREPRLVGAVAAGSARAQRVKGRGGPAARATSRCGGRRTSCRGKLSRGRISGQRCPQCPSRQRGSRPARSAERPLRSELQRQPPVGTRVPGAGAVSETHPHPSCDLRTMKLRPRSLSKPHASLPPPVHAPARAGGPRQTRTASWSRPAPRPGTPGWPRPRRRGTRCLGCTGDTRGGGFPSGGGGLQSHTAAANAKQGGRTGNGRSPAAPTPTVEVGCVVVQDPESAARTWRYTCGDARGAQRLQRSRHPRSRAGRVLDSPHALLRHLRRGGHAARPTARARGGGRGRGQPCRACLVLCARRTPPLQIPLLSMATH